MRLGRALVYRSQENSKIMANSIALATKFQAILDEIYKLASLTSRMDAQTKPVDFGGVNVVNIFKTSMVGMGTYSRATGYPGGDVTGTWETLTLAASRGRSFSIDRMDNEETLGQAFGTLAGEFIRTQVVPEVDAYRFSKYASWAGITEVGTPATLASGTVLAAIDVAAAAMDAAEVPPDGRILFVSDAVNTYLKSALTRYLANESGVNRIVKILDNMEVIMVPQTRFYKGITLDAGGSSSSGGFTKTASTGRNINFLLVHPSAALQATKLAQLKIFTPEENQTADAWLIQYRLYHDAFVYDNKQKGIYSHIMAS
jgi:hypothetical protein